MSTRKQDQGRFSPKRKMEAVVRLLGGEDLDLLSRELGVTARKLWEWRDAFLASGQTGQEPSGERPGRGDPGVGGDGGRPDHALGVVAQEAVRRMKGYAPPFVPRRPTR